MKRGSLKGHLIEALKSDAAASTYDHHHQVDRELGTALDRVAARNDSASRRISEIAGKLNLLWKHRDALSGTQVAYLVAALIYLISPVDLIPDVIPVAGYSDDVIVLLYVLNSVLAGAFELIEAVQKAGHELIEDATTSAVQRSAAAVVIGLWGMTTSSALALCVAVALQGLPAPLMMYMTVVCLFTLGWNAGVALRTYRRYQILPGAVRDRVISAVAARLSLAHGVAIAIPVLSIASIGVARLAI